MFSVAKRVSFHTSELRAGRWTKMDSVLLNGKTLGVIGTGNVGKEVTRLGQALGMEVIAWTFNPSHERANELSLNFVELDDLLQRSDVVSLHVRLTDESRRMIGPREFNLMKRDAILINAGRGDLVDTDALVSALQSGNIAGAGLDVFDIEPLTVDHPILSCEHVALTPHLADQTPEGANLLNEGAVDNVIAFLEGRPRNVVT